MLNSPKYSNIYKKFILTPTFRSSSEIYNPLENNVNTKLNKIKKQNNKFRSKNSNKVHFLSDLQTPNNSLKNNLDSSNTTFNSTSFSFYKNKNKKKLLIKNFSQKTRRNIKLNFNSNQNLPKFRFNFNDIYTPKEEDKKIQFILSKINNWDIEHIPQIKESSLKSAQLFCKERRKSIEIQKELDAYGQQSLFQKLKSKNIFTKRGKFKLSAFNNLSLEKSNKHDLQQNIKKNNSMNDIEHNEKNINNSDLLNKKKAMNKLQTQTKRDFLEKRKNDQRQNENENNEILIKTYKYILMNKYKKNKFTELIDVIYRLLDQAHEECRLCVDIINQKIQSAQRFYGAWIDINHVLNQKKSNYMTPNNSNNPIEHDEHIQIEKSKGKSRKKNLETYEERMKKYREYIQIVDDLKNNIKAYQDKYNEIKNDLDILIENSKNNIKKLQNEIGKLKFIFKELKSQETEYYLNILKKGEDTRTEGLSWVVKKLLELKKNIDEPSIYPDFLDLEQINYIIQISKLGFEYYQLKLILKSLKDPRTEKEMKFNSKILLKRKSQINFDFDAYVEEINNDKEKINQKLADLRTELAKNIGVSPFMRYKIENKKVNLIVEDYIHKLKKYALNYDSSLLEGEDPERDLKLSFLFGDDKEKEKEYFNDVISLSKRTKKLENIIKCLRKDEYKIFQEKTKYNDFKEKITKTFYNKLYSALFGTYIFEISSDNDYSLLGE